LHLLLGFGAEVGFFSCAPAIVPSVTSTAAAVAAIKPFDSLVTAFPQKSTCTIRRLQIGIEGTLRQKLRARLFLSVATCNVIFLPQSAALRQGERLLQPVVAPEQLFAHQE
jgi:hypothetical protein